MPESTLNSYQFKTPNASVGSNAANQQRASALDPTGGRSGAYGVRSPQTPSQGRATAQAPQAPRAPQSPMQAAAPAIQPGQPGAPQNPILPDFSGITSQQRQAFMMSLYNSALPQQPPTGVGAGAFGQDAQRAGGMATLAQNAPYGIPVNPYSGSDITRLSNNPFDATSAARNLFR
jgi:hypothetical protein